MSQVHAARKAVKSPVRVGKLENVNKVALSEGHAVALDDSGYVYTWGVDDYGQLGRGWMPGMLQTVKSDARWRSRTVPERVVNNGFRGDESRRYSGGTRTHARSYLERLHLGLG